MTNYGWGIDGFGRQFLCRGDEQQILLCMLPGCSAQIGIDLLEQQDLARGVQLELLAVA